MQIMRSVYAAASDKIRTVKSAQLRPIMEDLVREVADVLGVPEPAATVLMRDHKWSKVGGRAEYFCNSRWKVYLNLSRAHVFLP